MRRACLQVEVGKAGMIGGTGTRAIPVEFSLRCLDPQVVDAGKPALHKAAWREIPVLVSVGAEPVERVVVPFIGEANGDPVLGEGPQFLDQAIVELPGPLARQEFDDAAPPLNQLAAISPLSITRLSAQAPPRPPEIPSL